MIFQKELIENLNLNSKKIAIEDGINKISYQTLKKQSDKLTSVLLSKNLPSETIIGVQLTKVADIVTSIIGILNARCVFVLIDDRIPPERLNSIIKETSLKYVITSSESGLDWSHTVLEEKFYIENIFNLNNLEYDIHYPEFNENDSVYIYFTSGSTGIPKGIIGKNCSLIQFIKWEIDEFSIDSSSRVSQLISPYFDAFLRDIFTPLLAGGTICIPPTDEDFFSAHKIISWVENAKISLIHCVPSIFRLINSTTLTSDNFKSLKYILLSGERIIPSELISWYQAFKSRIQLVNLYGTTETTMIKTFYRLNPHDAYTSKIPIGLPINDTELFVLNKDLTPCDLLVVGDLYIATEYLTKGYLNNQLLTDEKFITLNTTTRGVQQAFKTGDTARVLANGQIDLLGRKDRQIKIRGVRVELDEIENLLNRSELIKNAVVINRYEKNGDQSLIAYFLKADNVDSDVSFREKLQLHMKKYLSDVMIPLDYIQLSDLPILSNGKINYKALEEYTTNTLIVEPVNETEEKLLIIWKNILGDKEISTAEGFQAIGGNSISIMRLIGYIYKEFNIRIPLAVLFNNLTIKSQASYINQAVNENTYTIEKCNLQPYYNLSSAQQGIFYNYELNKYGISYNLPMAWEIRDGIDKDKIKNTFQQLIERHESLRTSFNYFGEDVVQYVYDYVDFDLKNIEINEVELQEAIQNFISPFDLSKAPLFRAGVIHTETDKYFLVFDIHHIICDGMSQAILLSDFVKFYNNQTLSPLPIQYKEYAEWEKRFKSLDQYTACREFWLDNFDGNIPRLNMPTTNKNTFDPAHLGSDVRFEILKSDFDQMLGFLKESDLTVFAGLFTAYFIFLAQITGQEDMVIGATTSGRTQHELEEVVGMFVKTLPIRYKLDLNLPLKDALREIHSYLLQANSKQFYNLGDIITELNKSNKFIESNLFDVTISFLNYNNTEAVLLDDKFATYYFDGISSKYAMNLYVQESDSMFYFRMECATTYFTQDDIKLLSQQLSHLIKKMSENLDARILDIIGNPNQISQIEEGDIAFNL